MKTCETCQHWVETWNGDEDLRICVWHTGVNNTSAATVDFVKGPLMTRNAFCCPSWAKRQVEYPTRD